MENLKSFDEFLERRFPESMVHSATGNRLQQSFLAHGAAQCGACTPGMLMAAAALLERKPATDQALTELTAA